VTMTRNHRGNLRSAKRGDSIFALSGPNRRKFWVSHTSISIFMRRGDSRESSWPSRQKSGRRKFDVHGIAAGLDAGTIAGVSITQLDVIVPSRGAMFECRSVERRCRLQSSELAETITVCIVL